MPETIYVKSVDQAQGKKGPYLKVIDSHDQWYFVHDQSLFDQVTQGATLVAEIDQQSSNGKTFRTIKSISSVVKSNGSNPTAEGSTEKSDAIRRAVALKAAVELIAARTELSCEFGSVITWAERFAEWLEGPPF